MGLNTFVAGDEILASEVNENFSKINKQAGHLSYVVGGFYSTIFHYHEYENLSTLRFVLNFCRGRIYSTRPYCGLDESSPYIITHYFIIL